MHRGLNLVSVCLLLTTTSILGSTMCGSNFWLECKHVAPGIDVLSGPINFHDLPYNLTPAYPESDFLPSVNTKCHPSRLLDHDLSDNDSDTFLSDSLPTLLLSETDTAHPSPNDFKIKCYSTVAVKSTHNNITLPFMRILQSFASRHS